MAQAKVGIPQLTACIEAKRSVNHEAPNIPLPEPAVAIVLQSNTYQEHLAARPRARSERMSTSTIEKTETMTDADADQRNAGANPKIRSISKRPRN